MDCLCACAMCCNNRNWTFLCTVSFAIALDQPGMSSYVMVYPSQAATTPISPAALLAGDLSVFHDGFVSSGNITHAAAGVAATRTVTSVQDAT